MIELTKEERKGGNENRVSFTHMHTHRREKERERERERHREIQRDRDSEKERQRGKKGERERQRHTERHTERNTDIHRVSTTLILIIVKVLTKMSAIQIWDKNYLQYQLIIASNSGFYVGILSYIVKH